MIAIGEAGTSPRPDSAMAHGTNEWSGIFPSTNADSRGQSLYRKTVPRYVGTLPHIGLFAMTMGNLSILTAFAWLLAASNRSQALPVQDQASHTIIPSSCFSSQSEFEQYFNYNYPWGDDHNGAARMDEAHVSLAGGYLTETAERVECQPDTDGGLAINYLSGTFHGKQTYTVNAGGGFDFSADFKAPVDQGTWPAFWLTGVDSWPPEIDMAEWKGSGKISFNTFNTSSEVKAMDGEYPDSDEWHNIKTTIRDENGKDVVIQFFMNGELQDTQYGKDFVGKANYFIINLQMEGSSGTPGPNGS